MDAIAERLKEERQRLKATQEEFRLWGGVAIRAQQNYEAGGRLPDAGYLRGIAERGVDCQYILTGVRSLNMKDVERAGMEQFKVQFPPVVKLQKDIDEGLLASVLADVIRVCETFPQLQDLDDHDMAKAVVAIYQKRKGGDSEEQLASVVAALTRKAG